MNEKEREGERKKSEKIQRKEWEEKNLKQNSQEIISSNEKVRMRKRDSEKQREKEKKWERERHREKSKSFKLKTKK